MGQSIYDKYQLVLGRLTIAIIKLVLLEINIALTEIYLANISSPLQDN